MVYIIESLIAERKTVSFFFLIKKNIIIFKGKSNHLSKLFWY